MTVRIAVVGVGYWGINLVRTLAADPRVDLAYLCDPDPAAIARAAAIAPRAAPIASAPEALAAPDVDAVVIATPAATHAALAANAFEAGKHVFVEKPLALGVADADRVLRAARRARRVGMVGHLMLFHPAVVRMRELLVAGELGELLYLTAVRANLGRLRADENALWSLGPHDFAIVDYLVGRAPTSVAAHGASYLQPGVHDVAFAHLSFARPDGAPPVLAHVHVSWLSPRKERRVILVGSRKMVEFDDTSPDKLRIFDRGYDRPPEFTDYGQYLILRDGDVHIPRVPMVEPLAAQMRAFVDRVEAGAVELDSLETGRRVTAMLEAADRSLRGAAA